MYVISKGREQVLPFGENKKIYNFVVPTEEVEKYKQVGCLNVFGVTGGLVAARNFALDHAFSKSNICVQISDDFVRVKVNNFLEKKQNVTLDGCIEETVKLFNTINCVKLLGIPPNDNPFIYNKYLSKNTFCVGDLLFVKPSSPRFDPKLTTKEDYDFTLQHKKKYGNCLRFQKYLYLFKHYTNKGGVFDIRNTETEQKNINYLKAKWGGQIQLNPRRINEIILKTNQK